MDIVLSARRAPPFPQCEEVSTPTIETDSNGEINTLDDFAAAVGSADEQVGDGEEVFSDSRSLRTAKFHFTLRPELR